MIRSFLFVPADSERKVRKASSSNADALIFDLEDSVVAAARPKARRIARAAIRDSENAWVRINPLDSEDADPDLDAVMPAGPRGIVLPKPDSAADTIDLAARLDELEDEHGLTPGQTRILPLCTERPEALFNLGGYVGAGDRLAGLSWGAEDLSAAVGALSNRSESGEWLAPYQLARSLCLFAAAAAGVPAIDTVYTDFRNQAGLERFAANARRDGFSGMLAIHPEQVDIINAAFVPSAEEVARAKRIVAMFADNPDAGTLAVDGEMIDRPHFLQATRIVELAESLAARQERGI